MSSINFVDKITVVPASWLNDVNNAVYNVLGFTPGSSPGTSTSGFGGLKNYLHNPNFLIAQRGISGTLTSNSASNFTDRWIAQSSNSNANWSIFNASIVNLPAGYPAGYMFIQPTGAGNTACTLTQRIEAAESTYLQNKTVTLSFWAYCTSGTPSVSLTALAPTGIDNYGSASVIFGPTTIVSALTNTLTRYSYTFTLGDTRNGLQLNISSGGVTSGQSFVIAGLQLEIGSTATQLELMPKALEYIRCLRYLQIRGGNTIVEPLSILQVFSVSAAQGTIPYLAPMRIAPSLTLSAAGDWAITTAANTLTSLSTLTLANATTTATEVVATASAATVVAGNATRLVANNTNNARFILSAEL
jgi:hypothetical protein